MDSLQIKTSLITYLNPIKGGIPIHIAITLNDSVSFESVYWIHPSGARYLEIQTNFLELFDVVATEQLPFYNELMDDIDLILPNKDEIFLELLSTNSTSEDTTFKE